MVLFSKKTGKFLSLLLFALASQKGSCDADLSMPWMEKETNKITNLENQVLQIREEKVTHAYGVKHTPVRMHRGRQGIFIEPSFLFWKASNPGFRYARNISSEFLTKVLQVTDSEYLRVHNRYHPGGRIDVGINFDYDNWDLWATWTYYHAKDKGYFDNENYYEDNYTEVGLMPVNGDQGTYRGFNNGVFRTARGNWRFNYNTVDLQMGKGFFLTKNVSFSPFFGLRGGMLYQGFLTDFHKNFDDYYSPIDPAYSFTYRAHSNYWGVGPRLGCDGKWCFLKNFGFKGLASGALLYGTRRVHSHTYMSVFTEDEQQNLIVTPREELGSNRYSSHLVVPTIQLSLGLDWGQWYCKGRFYVGLDATWECNYWWNQYSLNSAYTDPAFVDTNEEALEMEGLTVRARFAF